MKVYGGLERSLGVGGQKGTAASATGQVLNGEGRQSSRTPCSGSRLKATGGMRVRGRACTLAVAMCRFGGWVLL